MNTQVNKKEKSTLELKITVPKEQVKEAYELLFKEVVANAELKGFRKGQAPVEMVREKTDISKLYGEVINKLLQTYYPQALKEHQIAPIANPKVEINEFDIEKDFEFTATVATRPEIKIGDYISELKTSYAAKSIEMKKMNEEKLKAGEQLEHEHIHLTADDVIGAVVKVSKIDLPDLVLDDETDRMMSRLVDQAQSIGLSLEQYLKSNNKTVETLRTEYKEIANRNLTAEFAMSDLIIKRNIEVSDTEIDDMINAAGDANIKESLNTPMQRMYVKSILSKNKLLTSIIKEVEGDKHESETSEETK